MNNTLDYIAGQLKALTAIPSPTELYKLRQIICLKYFAKWGTNQSFQIRETCL